MSRTTRLVHTEWYGEHAGELGDHDVIVAEGDDATEHEPPWQSEPLAFLRGHDPYDPEVQAAVGTMILETQWPTDTTPQPSIRTSCTTRTANPSPPPPREGALAQSPRHHNEPAARRHPPK